MLNRYVNLDTNRLIHGKWQGEDLDDVADEDSDYLREILREEGLLAEDRAAIELALVQGCSGEDAQS